MMRGKTENKLSNAEKWEMIKSALADDKIRQMSSRHISQLYGVSDKFVRKVRTYLYPEQTHVLVRGKGGSQYLRPAHREDIVVIPQPAIKPEDQHLFLIMVNRMCLGDAIYRLDDEGFGWRLEYMEFEMEAMEKKYLLYYRDQLIGKLDIRGGQDIRLIRRQVSEVCTNYGFTRENAYLVCGGAVTPPQSTSHISRATSFKYV